MVIILNRLGEIMNKRINIKLGVWILFILLVVFSGIWYLNSKDNGESYYLNFAIETNNNVNNPINYEEIIDKLRDEYDNRDVMGILEIGNTDYRVPLLQGSDNDYYLNHDAYGNSNMMGAIYLDYRVDIDNSKKLLIYGHNSSNIDMPFKILEEFYDKDYYDNHKYIWITTSKMKKEYEIFSVYVETSDFSYMNINFDNDEDYLSHIRKLKDKSMYESDIELSSDDEILILQTCSTHKDYSNYQKKYLLIILKRI